MMAPGRAETGDNMEADAIVRALNAEAKRTNGEHPSGHVLFLDGVPYSVPRRQWGATHAASGRPFGLPRAKKETLHLRRATQSPGWTSCTCVMCREPT